MYISLSKKFIFFHIPKNAGTSIKDQLSKHVPIESEIFQWSSLYYDITKDPEGLHFKSQTKILPYHGNQLSIKPLLEHVGQRVTNFFEFVVVRHPYERLKSFVKYSHTLKRINKGYILSVDDVLDIIEKQEQNFYATQFRWIDNPLTSKVYVYKCEELAQSGWDEIKTKINSNLEDLKHINVSPNQDIILTTEQKLRCYNLLKREFIELNYDP